MFEETDNISTFSYDSSDEGASPDAFSLSKLAEAVRTVFRIDDCVLVKLAEGGYHKVYEISASDNEIPSSVVRVAALAFPRDKVESEIATLQYIACNTTIHTPLVYAWNTEDDNPVGLEYMILEKIPGVPANEVWETLPFEKKQAVVLEVAEHIIQLFRLRFDTGGSLYRVPGVDQENFHVGPIVSTPFYRALDGIIRFPDSPVTGDEIRKYRGPFPDPTSYLRSFLDVELDLVRHDQVRRRRILQYELDNDEERLEHGIRILEKAVQLASVYPGDICVSRPLTTPGRPFSLRMDDFRLSNMMIDPSTGHITGLLDFEGASVAPLWECAYMPRWLQDYEEWDGTFEGGSSSEKSSLRKVFLDKIDEIDKTGEWRRAHDNGRPFREFTNLLNFTVGVWANEDIEDWIDERLKWAADHPGEGFKVEEGDSVVST